MASSLRIAAHALTMQWSPQSFACCSACAQSYQHGNAEQSAHLSCNGRSHRSASHGMARHARYAKPQHLPWHHRNMYSDAYDTNTKYFANACTRYCPVQTRTPVYFKFERKNTHEWQLLQRFLPAWCGLYALLVPGSSTRWMVRLRRAHPAAVACPPL